MNEKKMISYWPWLALLLSIASILYLLFSPVFSIKTIKCTHASYTQCPQELLAELERSKDEKIWFFDTGSLTKKLYSSLPKADRVSVRLHYPDTLIVTVYPETEFLYLKVATNSASLVLDSEGRIVDQAINQENPYPEIISPNSGSIGVKKPTDIPEIDFSVRLIGALNKTYMPPYKVFITDPANIKLYFGDGSQALVSSNSDFTRQVNSLQLILNKDTMLSDEPRVDVRFKQPVIKPSL